MKACVNKVCCPPIFVPHSMGKAEAISLNVFTQMLIRLGRRVALDWLPIRQESDLELSVSRLRNVTL